jgi:hypothetical protein
MIVEEENWIVQGQHVYVYTCGDFPIATAVAFALDWPGSYSGYSSSIKSTIILGP